MHACPKCKRELTRVFDDEIAREIARKRLGLDEKSDERMEQLELENKALKIDLKSLKEKVEANTNRIDELRDSTIPQVRKQLANEIAKLMVKKAKKKSTFKPV